MKIYFAGSIRGGRTDVHIYKELISHLKRFGIVLTEHVGSSNLTNTGENIPLDTIHDRDLEWLLDCDVLIAEISTPSLGVGYEIGRAIENGKKTLCLYSAQKEETVSGIIRGCPKLCASSYNTTKEAKLIIDRFIKEN